MGKRRKTPGGGSTKKRKAVAANDVDDDEFFDADEGIFAGSEDEEEQQEASDKEEKAETVHEKKVRLAKAYLDKLKAKAAADEEEADGEDGREEREGRRDTMVADILRQEQQEESGRVQRKLASRVVHPEAAAEGITVVRKHRQSITALALTEDDTSGFSASKDGLILQWDVETGKTYKYEWPNEELRTTGVQKSHGKTKTSSKRILALAVDSSGRYLATGGLDRAVHLWDIRTQKHIEAFPGHRGAVSSLVFRQGTTQLISGSFDRTIKLWSADDRSYMDTLFGHQSEILTVDCVRQERLLSAGRDRTLRFWKVPEETQLVFRGHAASIESCCFLTNGEFLSGSDDGSVALWSIMKKKPVFVARNAHGPPTDTERKSISSDMPNGHSNGNDVQNLIRSGTAESWVGAVAGCRSSDLAATGAGDGKIQLWGIEDGNRSLKPLHGLPVKGFVNALAFARSGRFLVAGIGQEPRMGRWARNSQARNGVVLHKIEFS